MPDKSQIERAPRLPLDVEVNCDGEHIAYSKNISTSGIAVITDKELETGKFIQLKFHLPDVPEEITAFGKVVRSESVSENFFECGISFWEINDEDRNALQVFFRESRV